MTTVKTILAFFGLALLVAAWLGAVVAPIAFVWKAAWPLVIVGFATPLVYKTVLYLLKFLKITQ